MCYRNLFKNVAREILRSRFFPLQSIDICVQKFATVFETNKNSIVKGVGIAKNGFFRRDSTKSLINNYFILINYNF